jgi:hypothetical protein
MSKIGTGEGAQAYGHGIYAAENPNVAKNYAPRDFDYEKSLMDAYKRHEQQGDYEAMEIYERAMMHETPAEIRASALDPESVLYGMQDTALRVADEIAEIPINSNLYKVDIPDDQIAKMLDWDKPLSEQVKLSKALGNAMGRMEPRQELEVFLNSDFAKSFPNTSEVERAKRVWASGTDEDIADWFAKQKAMQSSSYNLFGYESGSGGYGRLSAMLGGDVQASKALQEQGIPGIKYLDGGSRSGGQGTSNFVLFADDIAKILERNDQPIGELAEMLSSGKKVKP